MNSDPSRVKGRWSSISSRRKARCQGTTRFVRLFFGSSDHSSQAGSSITGDSGGGSKWARWIYPQQLSDLICALWRTIDVVLVGWKEGCRVYSTGIALAAYKPDFCWTSSYKASKFSKAVQGCFSRQLMTIWRVQLLAKE
jgi:hypothetical protein